MGRWLASGVMLRAMNGPKHRPPAMLDVVVSPKRAPERLIRRVVLVGVACARMLPPTSPAVETGETSGSHCNPPQR
jgi:hypothetical protein